MVRKGNYKRKWTPELVDEFLRRISIEGMSARQVGRMDDMPSYESFHILKSRDAEINRRYLEAWRAERLR